jgi:hypothetical protein
VGFRADVVDVDAVLADEFAAEAAREVELVHD